MSRLYAAVALLVALVTQNGHCPKYDSPEKSHSKSVRWRGWGYLPKLPETHHNWLPVR